MSESTDIWPPSGEEIVVWAECGYVAPFEGGVLANASSHVKVVIELSEETDGESNFVLELVSTVQSRRCVMVISAGIFGRTKLKASREGSIIVIDAVFAHPDLSSHVADALGSSPPGVLVEEYGELFVIAWKATRLSFELNGGRESGESESDCVFHFCFSCL